MFDRRHELSTTDPRYYKWTQWVFLKLHELGLAYKKKAAVNWCPSCKTVLSNEQVVNGACERCGTLVEQRMLEQWFFRITDYAPRLLADLESIDWSESTKTAQRNWLGKSEGAELVFTDDAVAELARMAFAANDRMENIGARRLHTVMAALMEQLLFDLPEYPDKRIVYDAVKVRETLSTIVNDDDLRRYIL